MTLMAFPHAGLDNCRRVFIRDMRLDMRIGIYPHEQNKQQYVLANIEFWVPLEATAPTRDRIDDVVDYDFVRPAIRQLVERGHINLLETLCDAIVAICFTHPLVAAARVVAEKREAHPDCASVGIEVFRLRQASTPSTFI